MRASLLRRWVIAGTITVTGAAAAERAGLAAAAGVDVWNLPDLERELEQHEQTEARLDVESDVVADRIAAKEDLIRELVAGRATLAGVTDRFLELNRDRPATMKVLRQTYRTADPREMTARNVLDYATQHRFPSPAARAAAARRLAAEYARLFPAAGAPMNQ